MRAIVHCFLCVGLLLGVLAANAAPAKKRPVKSTKTTTKKTSTTKKSTSKSRAKSSTARKSPAKKTTAKSTKRPVRRRSTTTRRRVRRPAGQARPSTERYAEIQSALKQKGFYEGEPDGKWNDASTAALKRFQESQNLKPDGKIGSLSLIALGLGPKRAGIAPPPPTSPAADAPPADTPPIPTQEEKSLNNKAPQ